MKDVKVRRVHHTNKRESGTSTQGWTMVIDGLEEWERDILLEHLGRVGLSRPASVHGNLIHSYIHVGKLTAEGNLAIAIDPTSWSTPNEEKILLWLAKIEEEVERWRYHDRPVLWQARDLMNSQINEAASRLAEVEESLSRLEDDLNADKQDEGPGPERDESETPPYIDVVFDGPPGPEAGRFVEVEDMHGASVRVGSWVNRDDGMWALRIYRGEPPRGRIVTLTHPEGRVTGVAVGPGSVVSREYLEDLREQGWRGLGQIPEKWIVDSEEEIIW